MNGGDEEFTPVTHEGVVAWARQQQAIEDKEEAERVTKQGPEDRKMEMLHEAHRVLWAELSAIRAVAARLNDSFLDALALMQGARVVHVSGVGKSGHIARKIAGTLTSTGTPANFLHPVEALHGDIGIVGEDDRVVLISRSGECDEVIALADALTVPILALTGGLKSRLAERANIVLDCYVATEACSTGLVPTCSTAVALAMGDALAIVLMKDRDFGADDFKAGHPGGAIGCS